MSFLTFWLNKAADRFSDISRLGWQLLTVAMTIFLIMLYSTSFSAIMSLQERFSDMMLAPAAKQLMPHYPVVISIDRPTLAHMGPWPWPWGRDQLANLVSAVATAKPRAIGIDILFSGKDTRSPAARARTLAHQVGANDKTSLQSLAGSLPDGDRLFAQALTLSALAPSPVILGLALDPSNQIGTSVKTPLPVRGRLQAKQLWHTKGWIGPPSRLAKAASGLGVLALQGDHDGALRRAPLLAIAGGRAVPGLAVELYRASTQSSLIMVDGAARTLHIGTRALPLGQDGQLRLVDLGSKQRGLQRISAYAILTKDAAALSRLKNAVVLIGGTAPELGGLRPKANGALVPSVELQAAAYAQIAAGIFPSRPSALVWIEVLALLLASGLGVFMAQKFAPLPGAGRVALLGLGWSVIAFLLCRYTFLLLNPIMVPATAFLSFASAALLVASHARQRALHIRLRFEQHLAPAVVQRIVENPDSLRLKGEMREVTALFTDIAKFSEMTDHANAPEQLIEVLDGYFDGLTRITIAHGGLVDKFVGDAMHALFNAPFTLENHAQCALDCAIEIDDFSEKFRQTPIAKKLGLGKTRIGIETGHAIVGDVGGNRKLDYTAHGRTINAAARLEQANKLFQTTILVGSGAEKQIKTSLMPLGDLKLRGFDGAHNIYTIWAKTIPAEDREHVRKTIQNSFSNPDQADRQLTDLAHKLDTPLLEVLNKRFLDGDN